MLLTILIATVFFLVNSISLVVGVFILSQAEGNLVFSPTDIGYMPKVLMVFSILITSTILAAIISWKPMRLIDAMVNAINRVAKGDYSVRLNFKSRHGIKEIQDVANSFNIMTEELGKVEILKRDFINDFSHEFKTPISSISGFARILKNNSLTKEEEKEYLDIILEESERLTELATNVLNLSKVEKQTILTGQTRFNVTEQLRQAVVLLGEKIEHTNLELIFEGEEVDLAGNRELLKQVWINLLDNAIKFSPIGGTLSCVVDDLGENVVVRITNEGSPIPIAEVPRIFDQFYQAESSRSTKGNGLGLTIVQKIVTLHGGAVSLVENKRDRVTFRVIVPKNMEILS